MLNMKLYFKVSLFLAVYIILSANAFAHGGGLNASGCHNERRTGGYHCHRSSSKPKTTYSQNPISSFNSNGSITQSNRTTVKTAQYLLNGLGYDTGVPDGILGDRTRVAVIQFQRDYSILVTGMIDQKLILDLAQITEIRLKKVG